jgi:alpha-galactosidase
MDLVALDKSGSIKGAKLFSFRSSTVPKWNLEQHIAWTALDEDGSCYLAAFNIESISTQLEIQLNQLNLSGTYMVRDLWKRENLEKADHSVVISVPSHGARLLKLSRF